MALCNAYCVIVSEALASSYNKILSCIRDGYGQDLEYANDTSRKSIIEYEVDTGRVGRMQNAGAWFTFHYLPGTDLKSRLQYGGSGSAYYEYEPKRDLLAQVRNRINGGVISQYDYENDAAGRRVAVSRSGSMMSETRTDYYGYNYRDELISATKNTEDTEYQYSYDDIGNRVSSLDLGTNRTYVANALGQYTSISNLCGLCALCGNSPQYDLDGNQILIQTSTGIWSVTYNAENRPVSWTRASDGTNIEMLFDRMGRRVEYVERTGPVTNRHHRFVYDGYLCVQRLDALANNLVELSFAWDPTEPVATRPLVLQRSGGYNLFYTHDGNKNVSELVFFQQSNGIAAHYEYAPFGAVIYQTSSTPVATYDFKMLNPYRNSSECDDDILGLTYYNFRHYDPITGRWCAMDRMFYPCNKYIFTGNRMDLIDVLGLKYGNPVSGSNGPVGPSNPYDRGGPEDGSDGKNGRDLIYISDRNGFDWPETAATIVFAFRNVRTKCAGDFDPNSQLGDCDCIKSLMIIMHGAKGLTENSSGVEWGDDFLVEDELSTGISDQFNGLRFCRECTIELRVCYQNNNSLLRARLETSTGCNVIMYSGKVNPLGKEKPQ